MRRGRVDVAELTRARQSSAADWVWAKTVPVSVTAFGRPWHERLECQPEAHASSSPIRPIVACDARYAGLERPVGLRDPCLHPRASVPHW